MRHFVLVIIKEVSGDNRGGVRGGDDAGDVLGRLDRGGAGGAAGLVVLGPLEVVEQGHIKGVEGIA